MSEPLRLSSLGPWTRKLAWNDKRERPATAAAEWILQNIPCSNGPMDPQTTDAIIDKLRKQGLSDADILAALWLARLNGHELAPTTKELTMTAPFTSRLNEEPPDPNDDNAYAVDPNEERIWAPYVAREMEARYLRAEMAGDTAMMEIIAMALAALLVKALEKVGRVKKEKERLREIQEEILRNAPTIAKRIQHLSARELREMRDAPTPDPRQPRPSTRPPVRRAPPRGR